MLKFKDSTGAVVAELKDEDSEPKFFIKIEDTKDKEEITQTIEQKE